jgi:pimeloyl-ACP methyl ester carboxylesterase
LRLDDGQLELRPLQPCASPVGIAATVVFDAALRRCYPVACAERNCDVRFVPLTDIGTPRYAYLKKIQQPVLVVNGHRDIMVPTINSFILQQHIPNATLVIYPDSGHGAIFQYPELFVSHGSLFLKN